MSDTAGEYDDDASRVIRVVTYNIHRCIGTDGELAPGRVAEVLRRLEPDIVALQEVDTSLDERTELGQLRVLARETGLEPVSGPTIERETGYYGNAVLSRFPVEEVIHHDLSVDDFEPRGALDVVLGVGNSSLRVVATHLGLRAAERREQVSRLLAALYRRPRGRAAVLMGDFNVWFRWSRNLRRLNSYLGFQPGLASFPARRPIFGLDRIWPVPRGIRRDSGVYDGELARTASDHLPVWADIQW